MVSNLLTDETIRALEKQDKDLGGQVKKWRPKILSLSMKLAKVTGDQFDDIVQDFLQKMWVDVTYYRTPQVRYQKQIWEVVEVEENDVLRLRRLDKEIFLKRSQTEVIKKASLGTFVYGGLSQYYIDRCSSFYTARHGYALDSEHPTIEKKSVQLSTGKVVKHTYPNYQKVGGVIALPPIKCENGVEVDIVDLVPGNFSTPEEETIYQSVVDYVKDQVSDPAKKLLDFLLQQDEDFRMWVDLEILRHQQSGETYQVPRLDEVSAAKYFSVSRPEVRVWKKEIIDALPKDFRDCSIISVMGK